MKYLEKSFSVGGYSKKYSDNWDAVFGNKEEEKEEVTEEEASAEEIKKRLEDMQASIKKSEAKVIKTLLEHKDD